MKSTIEPLEGNKVKLSVTIDADEFESAIDAAWKTIAKEVKVPGFRTGKVPRKVLESRIEPEYARSEALREALPDYYVKAVREHDADVIAQPSIEITAGEETGDVSFDATVEVRPEISLSGYHGLAITIPSPHPTDDDIADQVDRFRNQYSELVAVERPATAGDVVTIDIAGSQDDEVVEGLTAEGYTYEVGAGNIVPELDEQLEGAIVAAELAFDADHPDPDEGRVHFKVTVIEVKEKVLPELTDEWVADATEFETVDQFRDDIIDRLAKVRRRQASMAVQARLGDALAELVTDEVPDSLIGSEMRARLENLMMRLQQQGLDLETYLQVTGTEPQNFTEDLRNDATMAIKVDLAMRAVVKAEELDASDEELEQEIAKMAEAVGIDVDAARVELEQHDQIPGVRSEIGRRNALRWLTEIVSIVDERGQPVNRADLDLEEEEAVAEHDHDHDHDGHDHDPDHDHEGHYHDHEH